MIRGGYVEAYEISKCFVIENNTVWGCGGYKVNGVTGVDEVSDVTGDDVW